MARAWLGKLSGVVAALGAIALLASFPVEKSYASRAKLVQRVQKDAADDLFGGDPKPVGSPQELIIDDQKAFIGEKDGVHQVDESYLQKNGIYPLQLKSVEYSAGMARLGSGAALIAGLLGLTIVRRRSPSPA
jgi:hypothetical protein